MAFAGMYVAFVGLGDVQVKIVGGKVVAGGGKCVKVDSATLKSIVWDDLTHIVVSKPEPMNQSELFRKLGRNLDRDKVPPVFELGFINAGGGAAAEKKYKVNVIDDTQVDQTAALSITAPPQALGSSSLQDFDSPSKKLAPNPLLVRRAGAIRTNVNEHITRVFQELVNLLPPGMDTGNTFRRRSYTECIRSLTSLPYRVERLNQAFGLRGFGHNPKGSNLTKVHQILHDEDGLCEKLREVRRDPSLVPIAEFRNIWGIGTRKAQYLYTTLKCRSIADVRKLDEENPLMFSNMIKIGLRRYDDILQPVPKDEAARIFATVESFAKKINPMCEALICGSARREDDSTASDVDVLLVIPTCVVMDEDETAEDTDWDKTEEAALLQQLLADLSKAGVLTDHGAGLKKDFANYMGVCVDTTLPEPARVHRRIDIKVMPEPLRAFALLHFTGNVNFNRAMSSYANKFFTDDSPHGLKNTKVGLFRRTGLFDRHGESKQRGRIRCNTEHEIFAALHLQYRPPQERFSLDDLLPIPDSEPAAFAMKAVRAMKKEEIELFERVEPLEGADDGDDVGAAVKAAAAALTGAGAGAGAGAGGGGTASASKKRVRSDSDQDSSQQINPNCDCGLLCSKTQTNKPSSPNVGRWFWHCANRFANERKCNYFEFVDGLPNRTAASEGFVPVPLSPFRSSSQSPDRDYDHDHEHDRRGGRGAAGSRQGRAAVVTLDSAATATDRCFKCGKSGHWSYACPTRR